MRKGAGTVFVYLFAFILAGYVVIGRSHNNGSSPEQDEDRSAFQVCSGTIEIGVRITNEDGEPLPGVSVAASSTKHGVGGFTTGKERHATIVDGYFHILETGICNLRLNITKPGFYGETLKYTVMRDLSRVEDVTDTGVVVVLESRPTPAPMERIEGILKTDSQGPITAIKFQPGTRDATQLDTEKAGGLDALGGCCFLGLQLHDGQIDWTPRKSLGGGVYYEPKGAVLKSSRVEDGFILFEPQHEYPIAERGFREMRMAPKSGYAPSLELPPDTGDRVYFFCFLGGHFGKGYIVRPSLLEDNGEAVAVSVVRILVNPTGDRNVATLD